MIEKLFKNEESVKKWKAFKNRRPAVISIWLILISCFFSFTLLVTNKLYNSYGVAKQSVKNDKMMSAYMSEFVSFNVIDKDYIKSKLTNKP